MTVHGPQVAEEAAGDRLMRALDYRLHPEAERLSREQVAVVLHALADHTAIMASLDYRHDPTSPWPQATSVGRWMHDTADQLERAPRPDESIQVQREAEHFFGCGGKIVNDAYTDRVCLLCGTRWSNARPEGEQP